ncbi:MAG TPA: 5-formyltetrahydrofolate cyclo-ligase, partial [Paenalcaligenes sp.]|nr:5-formyltetrahydrofolate cyclo-ligase [Paenalcaligenes sp.]
MNSNVEHNVTTLRTRLLEKRNQQERMDTNRGGLLIRGRLFTWLATTRTRLQEEGQALPNKIAAFWSIANE